MKAAQDIQFQKRNQERYVRKRAKSASLPRPHPSAIFVGIDTDARRIWLIKPYRSCLG